MECEFVLNTSSEYIMKSVYISTIPILYILLITASENIIIFSGRVFLYRICGLALRDSVPEV